MWKFKFLPLFVALMCAVSSCTRSRTGTPFWIYVSLYPKAVADLTPKLEAAFPGVEFKWYQAGSETVAAKVNAELTGGKPQADLLIASDILWYEELKKRGALLPVNSADAQKLPAQYREPGGHYVVSRLATMVIGYNSGAITHAPSSFAALASPECKAKVAFGNPLESGTAFTSVALLSRKLGWEYFERLRANDSLSAGGNSAVMGRIETMERPIGIILLENLLTAGRKNPKIRIVYPSDGPILIPGLMAVMKNTPDAVLAGKVHDWFLGLEAQRIMTQNDIYPVAEDAGTPKGAKPLKELQASALYADPRSLEELSANRDSIKQRFSKIMLE